MIDTTIIGSVISGASALVGALLGGSFVLFQTRKVTKDALTGRQQERLVDELANLRNVTEILLAQIIHFASNVENLASAYEAAKKNPSSTSLRSSLEAAANQYRDKYGELAVFARTKYAVTADSNALANALTAIALIGRFVELDYKATTMEEVFARKNEILAYLAELEREVQRSIHSLSTLVATRSQTSSVSTDRIEPPPTSSVV